MPVMPKGAQGLTAITASWYVGHTKTPEERVTWGKAPSYKIWYMWYGASEKYIHVNMPLKTVPLIWIT